MISLALILSCHFSYLIMPDWPKSQISIWPLIPFGLGHALFTIMLSPTVPIIVTNKEVLSNCFSLMKILEGFNIMTFTLAAGYLRQLTENYTSVTMLLMTCCLCAMVACYHLLHQNCW